MLGERAPILVSDARLREMSFGAWEGLTREQIVARSAAADSVSAPRFMTPEGGETFEALCERIAAALTSLADRTPADGRALVVTHAGALHAALRLLLGEDEAAALDVRFLPASYTSFAIEAGHARLLALNRTPYAES